MHIVGREERNPHTSPFFLEGENTSTESKPGLEHLRFFFPSESSELVVNIRESHASECNEKYREKKEGIEALTRPCVTG